MTSFTTSRACCATPEFWRTALGIDRARVLAFTFAYACLNACQWWSLQNDDVIQWSLGIAEIVEPHLQPI